MAVYSALELTAWLIVFSRETVRHLLSSGMSKQEQGTQSAEGAGISQEEVAWTRKLASAGIYSLSCRE